MALEEQCRREVLELHRFFEDWFKGKLERAERNFQRFSRALTQDFEIVSPGGARMGRKEVLAQVKAAYGSQGEDFQIVIKNLRSRPLAEGLHLVSYEEWQSVEEGEQGRLSSAVFRRDPRAPGGVRWVHVHETWIR